MVESTLRMNERMRPGDELQSADGHATLRFHADGDLALVRRDGAVVWTANTGGRAPGTLRMQEDGDLVLSGPDDEVLWAASGHGGKVGPAQRASTMVVRVDGLVILDERGEETWTSSPPGGEGPLCLTSFAVLL
jgi:hypothetical protein